MNKIILLHSRTCNIQSVGTAFVKHHFVSEKHSWKISWINEQKMPTLFSDCESVDLIGQVNNMFFLWG